jgi:hypothetical protein
MTTRTNLTKRQAPSKRREAGFFRQNARGLITAGGLVLVGLVLYLVQMPHRHGPVHYTQRFFTVDDGKTWFADSATKIPPFDKDGKQAVLAHVYRTPSGTEFVGYLERIAPQVQQALENPTPTGASGQAHTDLNAVQDTNAGGRQIKRPGDEKWVSITQFPLAPKILAVKCPDGSADAVPVEP